MSGDKYIEFTCLECGVTKMIRDTPKTRQQVHCRACAQKYRKRPERHVAPFLFRVLLTQVVAALMGARTEPEARWCMEFVDGFIGGDHAVEAAYHSSVEEMALFAWQNGRKLRSWVDDFTAGDGPI